MEKGVPIRSVSRSISVLQAINRYGSLSMTGIARYGALPYPTACRIVQTLMHEGLIEQEPSRKHYRPTALVESLAHGYRSDHLLIETAHPHMSRLTQKIGWPVFLAVRVGTQMVIRGSTHSETSLTYAPCYPGITVPLLTSATGQAWLSKLEDEDVGNLLRWVSETDTRRTLSADELQAVLAGVRRDGFASRPCMNDSPNRTASIALPIMVEGEIVAVLTLTYFAAALQSAAAIEKYLLLMGETTQAIAQSLAAFVDERSAA
jgi:IclR family mhp operon transcriptional activator